MGKHTTKAGRWLREVLQGVRRLVDRFLSFFGSLWMQIHRSMISKPQVIQLTIQIMDQIIFVA